MPRDQPLTAGRTWKLNMKKARLLLAMPSRRPLGEGSRICCTMLDSAASTVMPAHTGIIRCPLNSCRHLMATDVTHQKFDR